MAMILILVFVLGYLLIALEHNLHIDKAASALITGTLCWAILVLGWHEAPRIWSAPSTTSCTATAAMGRAAMAAR